MQIIHNLNKWKLIRSQCAAGQSLGFVPTMGNLHEGHASLYQRSLRENDVTVASIFVNPTQFDKQDDFVQYPKTLDSDIALLSKLGVDYCLVPTEDALYPDDYRFQLHENKSSLLMEGKHRKGHFNGVLTVVMKLLHLIRPSRAYFGEKDYQQFELIKDMAYAFMMDIQILSCPTIRETSGLAYSSRNNRLNAKQRLLAEQFAAIFHRRQSCLDTINALTDLGIQVEYIEDHQHRRYAAVFIDDIRLIDNYPL